MYKLSIFRVTHKDNEYYAIMSNADRDHLSIAFMYYEQTHVKEFVGSEDWVVDVLVHFYRMFKVFQTAEVEGIPIYASKYIWEIWEAFKGELDEINKCYKLLDNE